MFAIFDGPKQEIMRNYFNAHTSLPESALPSALKALSDCRGQIVGALRTEENPDSRQQLRVLYEGVTIILEFIAGGGGLPERSQRIASDVDESAPAVRDL